MSANDRQVGGDHYKNVDLPDHWDIVYRLKWCYLVGAATKYLWRLGRKGGSANNQLQDLEKAIHYLEKKKEQLLHEHMVACGLHEEPGPGYVDQDR